jgi:outer membrane protein assembly factor BamB
MRRALAVRYFFPVAILTFFPFSTRADDWPQWLGPQRDGVWREKGLLTKFPAGGPKIRWRAEVAGGYSGPAVADGRVYVTDRILNPGEKDPDNPFARTNSKGKERVRCLDAGSGKRLWEHAYDCQYKISYAYGPRATPVVHGGKVYTLGAMGDLLCLDVKDGGVVWSKNFPKDYGAPVPLWGFAAHPLLDGDQLICLVGGKDSVAVAFDKDTGKEKWRSLSLEASELGYCPPMIYPIGGKRQLIIWHPEAVNGLDPETGKLLWSQPFNVKANMSIPTPRLDGDKLLVASFYNGSMLLQLDTDKPGAKVLWKSKNGGEPLPKLTDNLSSVMATPIIKDGFIYGVCSYGELRCLKEDNGSRVWMTLKATGNVTDPDKQERWANVFLIPNGDRYFLPNEKGDLIIARLTPKGYEEIDRAHILEPTQKALTRKVIWSHPAFANKAMYARNDKEIVCVDLAAE